MEENASLLTSDTTTPCNFNITEDKPDLEINSECKSNSKILLGIYSQSKHTYRNAFGNSNRLVTLENRTSLMVKAIMPVLKDLK